MRRILLSVALIAALASCTPKNGSPLIAENSDLAVGKEVKSSLDTSKADTFRLQLGERAFVTGFANQLTVDVEVTLFGPDSTTIGSFDGPARGRENFQFTTKQAGAHILVVAPFEKNTGDYSLQLTRTEVVATDPTRRIEQLVSAQIGENGPGASVAVVRDGKIIYSQGFGHANLEYDIHNSPQTIFHIASVSKQFTAFAIAILADQGKLSVEDDIRKYLPEMHDFGTPITISQLVHHTSGLRDQWNLLAMAGWRLDDVITREQILRVITRQRELNFKPGEEYVYCNTGYTLMAEIVSRITGQSFAQWTKENIFEPLEMNNTQFYDDHEKVVENRAYSYYLADSVYNKSVLNYANVGATSLFTTVGDLSKWAMNFEMMKVGNEKVMAMMEHKFVLNKGDTIDYAFGQGIDQYKGLKTVSHGGSDAGYRSFLLRFPEQHFSVVVFSNFASFNTGGLAFSIAELYLADQLKEEPPKPEAPRAEEKKEPFDVGSVQLNDYTGRFYSEELETFYELEVMNDTLVAHHPRHNDFKLTPVKSDGFQAGVYWMGNVEFTRNAIRKVNGMRVSTGRVRNLVFVKE